MKVERESWGRGFHQELKELKQTPHEWLGQHWGGWKDRKLEEQVGGGNSGPNRIWQEIWIFILSAMASH